MYYIQNIVSSIKFKSIRSAGTAEAIGIMGIRNIGHGYFTRWVLMGSLWTFITFHSVFGVVGFHFF